jgi:hypothetical protein
LPSCSWTVIELDFWSKVTDWIDPALFWTWATNWS